MIAQLRAIEGLVLYVTYGCVTHIVIHVRLCGWVSNSAKQHKEQLKQLCHVLKTKNSAADQVRHLYPWITTKTKVTKRAHQLATIVGHARRAGRWCVQPKLRPTRLLCINVKV